MKVAMYERASFVDNQYLIYLPQAITPEQLQAVDSRFLLAHGIKLDIPAMLQQLQQASQSPLPSKASIPVPVIPMHEVQRDANGNRESWPAIAAQYQLSAKELLKLNPSYDRNPASLAAGDRLVVGRVEKTTTIASAGLPQRAPQTYNIAAECLYDYPAGMKLAEGKLSPCSQAHRLQQDVLLVNLSPSISQQMIVAPADKQSLNHLHLAKAASTRDKQVEPA